MYSVGSLLLQLKIVILLTTFQVGIVSVEQNKSDSDHLIVSVIGIEYLLEYVNPLKFF